MVYADTGPLDPEKHEHVKRSIEAFLASLHERGILAIGVLTKDSVGDRFIYRVSRGERAVLVQFPGVPMERIRRDDAAPAGFELVIADVYQTWKGALDLVAERLGLAAGR